MLTGNIEKHMANMCIIELGDPKNHKEAIESPNAGEWLKAMQEEIDSINQCGVWERADRPNKNIVSCRSVFKSKTSANNNQTRYRARLVARGFVQTQVTRAPNYNRRLL